MCYITELYEFRFACADYSSVWRYPKWRNKEAILASLLTGTPIGYQDADLIVLLLFM